jgi:membrane protease YdiL (CAAX protease family)
VDSAEREKFMEEQTPDMQRCDYCGRENQAAAAFCSDCGTPFQTTSGQGSETIESAADAPRLNASRATSILIIFLAAQLITSMMVGIAGSSLAVARGRNFQDPKEVAAFTKGITPIAVPFAALGGGIATVLASFLLVRNHLKDASPSGAAWTLGSAKQLFRGFILGLQAAIVYVVFASMAATLGFPHDKIGLLAQMASGSGLPYVSWLISMLLLAPPFEELLFRGILYGGYRHSFGHLKAAVITTLIFSLLHITEWIYFLPAVVGITGMAILALWIRLRYAAIGPAIAAHFGYNASLAVLLQLALVSSIPK